MYITKYYSRNISIKYSWQKKKPSVNLKSPNVAPKFTGNREDWRMC